MTNHQRFGRIVAMVTATREELIESHLPLARRLAWRYSRGPDQVEDLFQVASLGLVKAAGRFDPSLGNAFSSFAVPTMVGEIKRHFRDTSWAVHVPRPLRERAQRVEIEAKRLHETLGRTPTTGELADSLAMPREDVIEARAAMKCFDALSLDEPDRRADDSGSDATSAGARLGGVDGGFELVEDRATIRPALAELSDRDRRVLSLRYDRDLTQREVARRIGVSQMHVSRILRRSIATLQAAVGA